MLDLADDHVEVVLSARGYRVACEKPCRRENWRASGLAKLVRQQREEFVLAPIGDAERTFRLLEPRHVDKCADRAARRAVRLSQRNGRRQEPSQISVPSSNRDGMFVVRDLLSPRDAAKWESAPGISTPFDENRVMPSGCLHPCPSSDRFMSMPIRSSAARFDCCIDHSAFGILGDEHHGRYCIHQRREFVGARARLGFSTSLFAWRPRQRDGPVTSVDHIRRGMLRHRHRCAGAREIMRVRVRPSFARKGISAPPRVSSCVAVMYDARCSDVQMPSDTAFLPMTSSRVKPVSRKNASFAVKHVPSERRVIVVACGLTSNTVSNRRSDTRRASSAMRQHRGCRTLQRPNGQMRPSAWRLRTRATCQRYAPFEVRMRYSISLWRRTPYDLFPAAEQPGWFAGVYGDQGPLIRKGLLLAKPGEFEPAIIAPIRAGPARHTSR